MRIAQRLSQQEFDLPVQAAQIIIGPLLDGVQNGWVDAEKKGLALRHLDGVMFSWDLQSCEILLINRSRVDHRLGIMFAAQHNQKIADHCSLAITIKVHNFLRGQLIQRHLDHPNSAFNNLLPS